ncbi:MAG TPA: XrtA system polysaccharide deacetylase [Alphaproteobacteria bacterium]|nr:XrtA system polysaccharide deacetylase [Alphaproteobacteria bacterium]
MLMRPAAAARTGLVHAMTVDVEDYFQVSAFERHVSRADWDSRPRRVEANTDRVLELFADHGIRATFFTLGWVAQRCPQLIARIVQAGHELASHGMAHHRVSDQTPAAFREDVRTARKLLEDAGGVAVRGYRAASFSIGASQLWAHEVLAEEGYAYSSSIYPIRHDHYGIPDAPRFAYRPGAADLIEVPITTAPMLGRNVPCGGGGYFRLLPLGFSRWAMRRVAEREKEACVFYFHPWEIDPGQPRIPGVSLRTRVRHYTNLGSMADRLRRILTEFRWDRMDRIFLAGGEAP